jgi:hypothetical protein
VFDARPAARMLQLRPGMRTWPHSVRPAGVQWSWAVPLCLALGLSAALAGCGGDPAEAPADSSAAPVGGKADDAQRFRLRVTLHTSGDVSLRETDGTSLPGAPDPLTSFTCLPRFTRGAVERVECTRGTASVELLYRTDERTGTVIFRPRGRASNYRSYARCSSQSPRVPLPTTMSCWWVSVTQSGGLASPVPATAPGVEIPNAHWVEEGLLRSMAPRSAADYEALQTVGITAVLIFKKPTGTGRDVSDEIAALHDLGLADEAVLNVPFAWKDFPDFATPCEQTLEALRFLKTQRAAGRPTLVHCTVGEDRTGYLAGLYRLLEGETEPTTVFTDEMCERGFGSGNPFKPTTVTGAIAEGLIPLYRKMAFKILSGELTWDLEAAACATDPAGDPTFTSDPELAAAGYTCGTFTAFAP